MTVTRNVTLSSFHVPIRADTAIFNILTFVMKGEMALTEMALTDVFNLSTIFLKVRTVLSAYYNCSP